MRVLRSLLVLLRLLALLAFALPAGAADGDEHRDAEAPSRRNRPPSLLPGSIILRPGMADDAGLLRIVRSGRRVDIVIRADDPDGDPISFTARGLPSGATLDESEGVVTWTPTRAQEGKHKIDVDVSDGKLTTTESFTFTVNPNRPPHAVNERTLLFTAIAAPEPDFGPITSGDSQSSVIARDEDGDELSIAVKQQPPGAKVEVSREAAVFRWAPTETDVGEHELVVEVSDGELRTTVERKIVVFPEWSRRDYKGWFLLGGGPSGFVTYDDGELFVGGAVDITFAALRENAEDGYRCAHGTRHSGCHASHHRFYAEFEVLDSLRDDEPSLFTYGAGYSASFEWSPERRTFIPHYGIEVGGLVRDELGHRAQTRPYLGLHVFASNDLWLNAMLGYRVVPAELYELSGPTFALTAVVNPW